MTSDIHSRHRRVRALAAEAAGLRTGIADADARLTRLRRARDAEARRTDPRLSGPPRPLAGLGDDITAAETRLARLREALRRVEAGLAEELRGFAEVSDPRDAVTGLDGGTPLLLMPLRIETRFTPTELWVRIYPDQWAVDGFEERLSDTEVVNATRFWAGVFRAGGDEGMRRAAWRALVAACGSGRAGWVVDRFAPLTPTAEPVRTSPDEVILVVAGDLTLTAAERDAAARYWELVWRANGDPGGAFAAELRGAVGDARADTVLGLPPHAFEERPEGVDPEQAQVTVVFCELPSPADTKLSAWTLASRAGLLPDRIVLIGRESGQTVLEFTGEPIPPALAVGPDPSAGPGDQFRIENGELVMPDDLRWMVDFDAAVGVGMAMRVPLEPRMENGFDRLFAVGIRAGAGPGDDQKDLEELLTHHHRSRSGMSIPAQGTPTNNTEGVPSGFSRLDDPDLSYDRYLGTGSRLVDEPRWAAKQDGQWLAECLGVDPAVFGAVAGAAGGDQAESLAMNTALWPATWGYFLESMMWPLFGDDAVTHTRNFFLGHVSGRGRIPALRLGRQPYGIVPATAYARLRFGTGGPGDPRDAADLATLTTLGDLLAVLTADLAKIIDAVPHAHAATGDPHQTLLDVVALHPASVEFHQRYAESVSDLFNRFRFDNLGRDFLDVWNTLGHVATGRQLLAGLGYRGDDTPDILRKLFHTAQHRLKGPVIDDRPLSEEAPIRAYCDDGRDYLRWLGDAGRSKLEELRQETGFSGGQEPNALLYVLLRHAVLLSWWDAAVRLRLESGEITPAELLAARREPPFVHVATGQGTESRWSALYDEAPGITGDPFRPLHETIPDLFDKAAVSRLRQVMDAIKALSGLPTARLERLLAEHLDCAGHRVDAWRLGLATRRLLDMRGLTPGDGIDGVRPEPRRGIHVGAYGWLHDVRPEPRELKPVELPDELKPAFDHGSPLVRDSANGGFVHAPSLNHAATAAILRSGFMANATPDHPDTLALNLSSGRMRLAMSVLRGLREGQPLGGLLGHRFERGLHDRHTLAEVDVVIHPLRQAFPLAGDRDGRMGVDGLELVRHVRESGLSSYPFGRTDLPAASAAQRQAIDLEVERLLDVHDAIGDLVLAESVHQSVLGNADRTASSLDTIGRGGFPSDPAILETPGRGGTLTHRVAVHLRTGLDHTSSPVGGVAMTPRAMAEPGVNELAAAMLPPPAEVVARVRWTGHDGTARDLLVSQADLGLQPIDLLYLVRLESRAALGELDERILRHVAAAAGLRPDVTPIVHLTERVPGKATFFEIAPHVAHLRSLVTTSRPLRATDVLRTGEARAAADTLVQADRERVAAVAAELDGHLDELAALRAAIDAAVENPAPPDVDDLVAQAGAALVESGRFGLPSGGAAQLDAARAGLFGDLLGAVAALTGRWRARLARADDALAHDDALPPPATDAERVAVLLRADRELRGSPTKPVPTDAGPFRAAIETQRASFADRLAGFEAVAGAATGLADALEMISALLPVDAFDAEPFPVGGFADRARALCRDASAALSLMITQATARGEAAAGHLAAHDLATTGRSKVDALTAAVTALLGADAVFVPEFALPESLAAEWDAALQWSRTGGLLAGLASRSFPVDDWLHGVARVRGPMRAWEEATLLAGAFGRPEPELTPVQFPHATEPWLALEWPPGTSVTGDRLLYTAHYPAAFDPTAPQAGLLLDEWVEVVPDDTATTGIVFHHDSPDSEPPQAMLLVVPPDASAGWRWDDLVAALEDTFDLARQRALEPDAIAQTAYAAFLPATLSEATVRGLGISANLAVNNDLYRIMRADHA